MFLDIVVRQFDVEPVALTLLASMWSKPRLATLHHAA